MLMVFNLDWKRYDIQRQVSAANARMAELTAQANLSNYISFNLASIRAGEWIMPFGGREGEVEGRTVDFLRRMHQRIKRDLGKNKEYCTNRDAMEMLDNLKFQGHSLSAVWSKQTGILEENLKRSRCLDYFGDHVFGVKGGGRKTTPLTELYRTAIRQRKASLHDTIIVSDGTKGISEGKKLNPFAVLGYVNANQAWSAVSSRLTELERAGADFALVGGYTVSVMPDLLLQERELHSGPPLVDHKPLQ